MSKRGVQVTFIFNIVKSVSKRDIVVFDMFIQCRHQSNVQLTCLLGSDHFRIYFTTSIKSKLTSQNFICCSCNVAALLQNSKNFASCSWNVATTSQNGLTTLQPMVSPHCNQMETISQSSRNVLCWMGYHLTYKYGM